MRAFDPTDFEEINKWRRLRKVLVLAEWMYPPTGLICPKVAAGFLVTTDTGYALLENFVTNPEVPIRERRSAVVRIGLALEKIAKERGVKLLFSITNHPSIRNSCVGNGYKKLNKIFIYGKEI